MSLVYGSLFSGVGGMDLGLDRAGMTCKWQVEINEYASRVLAKHWPNVRRHDDVKTFPPNETEDWSVDVIAGGFPCQDLSHAGVGRGIRAERSGLFFQITRIARELRPRYIILENVTALIHNPEWMGVVLGELSESGFDAEWDCLPAAAFGADHIRDRIFIVAYPAGDRGGVFENKAPGRSSPLRSTSNFWGEVGKDGIGTLERRRLDSLRRAAESGVLPVADGIPTELAGYRGYGNAVVPQVAEFIGRRIIEHHLSQHASRNQS